MSNPRNAIAFEVKDRESPDRIKAGAYNFIYTSHFPPDGNNGPAGIAHACPCGCGVRNILFFRGRGVDGADEWDVEGTWPKVTLKPSIGVHKMSSGGFHWHGFLENGVFVER